MRLGLDDTVYRRRARVVRGLLRQAVGRPADPALWADYQLMRADSQAAPSQHQPGKFWDALQHELARELADESIKTFKRTVNTRFSGFSPGEPLYFDYAVNDIYSRLIERDPHSLLRTLDEPLLGYPFTVEIDGRPMGVDLLQSYSELLSMTEALEDPLAVPAVVEVGSGYGRVGDLIHRVSTVGCCYCIVDLPLPLAIAQNYLRTRWPHARLLEYGQGSRHGTLDADILAGYDFAFLAPWELELLGDRSVSISVNINSFQEMTQAQVRWYLDQFERITRDRIYLKEWLTFDNPRDDVRIVAEDVMPSAAWSRAWHRPAFPFPQWEEMLFLPAGVGRHVG